MQEALRKHAHLDADHSKRRVDHRHGVAQSTHFAGARGVVHTPGVTLDVLAPVLVRPFSEVGRKAARVQQLRLVSFERTDQQQRLLEESTAT